MCGNKAMEVPLALLDTGATMCHMTYPMWLRMKMDEMCWNANPSAFQRIGVNSIADITFENLPLIAEAVTLGNNKTAKIYDFRIDKLELGKLPLTILLENITVSLIEADAPGFTIGWNVLKYLKTTYSPILPIDPQNPDLDNMRINYYNLELTNEGQMLLMFDRYYDFSNNMQSMFNFL